MRFFRTVPRKIFSIHPVVPLVILLGTASCIQPDPKVLRLDKEYGFQAYLLGPRFYSEIRNQVESRVTEYDVVEFEAFGSRFADQQRFDQVGEVEIFSTPVTNVFAGVLDQTVYAFLIQVETDDDTRVAFQDSIIAYYGEPQSTTDTTYYMGPTVVRNHTLSWEANRVAMELGLGEGYAEVLVYDKELREKRVWIQQQITASQSSINPLVSELSGVGSVRLNTTASTARWRYRFRGERSPTPTTMYGTIDYSYVEPFFNVRGESLFGVKMAFVNMRFEGDSLQVLDVEFDNTQGQVVGFMDMFRVLERKLGRHTYSDTLYTIKGPYRRAYWYGDGVEVNLEEDRFRPEDPDRSDVHIRFIMDRVAVPEPRPILVEENVSVDSTSADILPVKADSALVDGGEESPAYQ